jgi:hypothetical protein
MTTNCVNVFCVVFFVAVTCLWADDQSRVKEPSSPALRIARSYLSACDNGDIDALNQLFLDQERATVLENATDEGSWENYRDHHLKPELEELKGVKFQLESEAEQKFGQVTIVRHIGSLAVPDRNNPDQRRKILAAVTYVVVEDAGRSKIAHLHWSSRAARPATTTPSTNPAR